MATQSRPPTCWFGVEEIRQSPQFYDRIANADRRWLPPRPRGSNERVRAQSFTRWFRFHNWQTQPDALPDLALIAPYAYHATWSFYYIDGRIWMYKADATCLQVGDGTGNERVDRRPVIPTPQMGQNDSSDEEDDNERDPRWDDWASLGFSLPDDDLSSYAEARGYCHTLACQRPNSRALTELLPPRYHATPARQNAQPGFGGLNGDFHILIALIAFSVHFSSWAQVFSYSLGQCYNRHQQPNAWPHRGPRGLLVHVWCPTHGYPLHYEDETQTPFERHVEILQDFSRGAYGTIVT